MEKLSDIVKKFCLLQDKPHSKKLGQNFILDPQILDKVISFTEPIQNKNILEIGGGVGSLTSRILKQKPKKLIVIEKDPNCVHAIKDWLDTTIIEADVLKVDLQTVLKELAPVKIIGNLPYNISTKILTLLSEYTPYIEDMLLMFQKEVAERIIAKPSTKSYGRLSILTQLCFMPKIVYQLKASVFTPPPKIDSSVVYFKPQKNIPSNIKRLALLTQTLFSKRRKMLRQTLDIEMLHKQNINPNLRPENLKPEEFLKLISS